MIFESGKIFGLGLRSERSTYHPVKIAEFQGSNFRFRKIGRNQKGVKLFFGRSQGGAQVQGGHWQHIAIIKAAGKKLLHISIVRKFGRRSCGNNFGKFSGFHTAFGFYNRNYCAQIIGICISGGCSNIKF